MLVAKQFGLKRRQVLSRPWYSLTSISILLSDRCRLPQQGTLAGQFTCVNNCQQLQAWVLGGNPAVTAGSKFACPGLLHSKSLSLNNEHWAFSMPLNAFHAQAYHKHSCAEVRTQLLRTVCTANMSCTSPDTLVLRPT